MAQTLKYNAREVQVLTHAEAICCRVLSNGKWEELDLYPTEQEKTVYNCLLRIQTALNGVGSLARVALYAVAIIEGERRIASLPRISLLNPEEIKHV